MPPDQRCSTAHANYHPSIFAGNWNSAKSALSWHAPGGLSAFLNLVSWICLILPEFASRPASSAHLSYRTNVSIRQMGARRATSLLGVEILWCICELDGWRTDRAVCYIENAWQMSAAGQLTVFKRIRLANKRTAVCLFPSFFCLYQTNNQSKGLEIGNQSIQKEARLFG